MTLLTTSFGLAALGAIAIFVISRFRMTQIPVSATFRVPARERYQPLLRLLQEGEFAFAGNNKALRKRMMAERHKLFREYLRCFAKDYGQLLNGVRLIMMQSRLDRPDLLKTLALSRAQFTLSLCRIEISLQMHQMGISGVDVTGLVRAMDSLRSAHASVFTPAAFAA